MTGKKGVRWVQQNSNPARILDRLETEGGWHSIEMVELLTGISPVNIRRALFRLRDRGLVESRICPDFAPRHSRDRRCLEWRILLGSSSGPGTAREPNPS